MADLLSDEKIEDGLRDVGWQREGERIVRDWTFKNFAEAIAFVNRVADAAEASNHHPDILVHGWNKVRLAVTNHSAGGLTDADFELAKKVNELD
jgi:4a-hydroxytetrahydrobiopterin dehydratase